MKYAARAFALVLCASFVGALLWAALHTTEPPHASPGKRAGELRTLEPNLADLPATEAIVTYLSDIRTTEIAGILRQVAADEAAALDAFLASLTPPPPPPVTYGAPQVSGDCSGFPLPAYIIERESGGDPNAVNPSSGTFGCAQLQPFHFHSGGACAGMSTDIAGQIACTYELQRRAGLSPWAL